MCASRPDLLKESSAIVRTVDCDSHPDGESLGYVIKIETTLEMPLLEVEDEQASRFHRNVPPALRPPCATSLQGGHESLIFGAVISNVRSEIVPAHLMKSLEIDNAMLKLLELRFCTHECRHDVLSPDILT